MFIQPRQMIKELGIYPKCTVIDIGVGNGYYLSEAFKLGGTNSKYIAIDNNKELLKRIKDSGIIGGYIVNTLLQNIEDEIILSNYIADYIILANVLHLINNKDQLIRECYRLLAPRGRLLFVDWIENNPINAIDEGHHENMLAIFYKNNFKIIKELPAGQYHFAYILERD